MKPEADDLLAQLGVTARDAGALEREVLKQVCVAQLVEMVCCTCGVPFALFNIRSLTGVVWKNLICKISRVKFVPD